MTFRKVVAAVFFSVILLYTSLLLWREYMFANERIVERGTILAMNEIRTALEKYKSKCQSYPQSLSKLVNASESCPNLQLDTKKLPLKDGWQNEFQYHTQEGTYFLRSMGNSWIESTPEMAPEIVHGLR